MKRLVLLIALIPSILHAECKIDEINVKYKEVPESRLQGQVAQAYKNKEKYIIEYSKELKYYPKILQDHILAHECAHHRLKHTSMPQAYISKTYEVEADCDAIKQLNWTSKEINELIEIWKNLYTMQYVKIRGEAIHKCLSQY